MTVLQFRDRRNEHYFVIANVEKISLQNNPDGTSYVKITTISGKVEVFSLSPRGVSQIKTFIKNISRGSSVIFTEEE